MLQTMLEFQHSLQHFTIELRSDSLGRSAAQQTGPGHHGRDGKEQGHHIGLLPDALKHAVDEHTDEAAQHTGAQG